MSNSNWQIGRAHYPDVLWQQTVKILIEMGITDHLTCMLRNQYVTTGHGTIDWFKIGKGIHKAVYCHPAYLTYM